MYLNIHSVAIKNVNSLQYKLRVAEFMLTNTDLDRFVNNIWEK